MTVVSVPMVFGKLSLGICTVCVIGLVSTSCITKKNDEVVTEAAAPPPAEYPEGAASGYAGSDPVPPPSNYGSGNPAPASSQPPAFQLRSGEQLVDHKIKPGENLSKIAAKYNSSVRRIQAANGMTSDRIYAGKTIKVPTSAAPNLAMSMPQAPTPPSTGYGTTAPAPPAASGGYGSTGGRYGAISPAPASPAPSQGGYPSTTTVPTPPPPPSYPSTGTQAPTPPVQVPSSPSSTSYPPQNSGGSFPTPSFGGSSIQFSD